MSTVTLSLPADELAEQISERVAVGRELLGLPRDTTADLATFKARYLSWDGFNDTMLRRAFKAEGLMTSTPANEYGSAGINGLALRMNRSAPLESVQVGPLLSEIEAKIELLASIIERLKLFPAHKEEESKIVTRAQWTRGEMLSACGILLSLSSLSVATAVAVSNNVAVVYVPASVATLGALGALIYRRSWRALVASLLAIALVAGGIFGGYLIWSQPPIAVLNNSTTGSIDSYGDQYLQLKSDVHVPVNFSVHGTVTGINDMQSLWILVAQENADHYYLQPGPCSMSTDRHQWTCSQVVVGRQGQDVNTRWQILLVKTEPNITAMWLDDLKNNNLDVPYMPDSIVRLDVKSTIRS